MIIIALILFLISLMSSLISLFFAYIQPKNATGKYILLTIIGILASLCAIITTLGWLIYLADCGGNQ